MGKMFFESEVLALVEMTDAAYDEETGEMAAGDADILAGLANEQIAPAMDRYKKAADFYANQAELCAAEIKRLQDRKKMFENKNKWLKNRILNAVQMLGGKFKSLLFTFGTRTTKSVETSEMLSLDSLPADLVVVEKKLNKTAAKEKLLAGETIPGVRLAENVNLFVK